MGVEAVGEEIRVAPVEDRARRSPVERPFVEGARAGEGDERRIKGCRQVVEVQQLLPRGFRGIVRHPDPGIDGLRDLQVQVYPGAASGVCEPLPSNRSRLELVVEVVADLGLHAEGVGGQWVQLEPQLSSRVEGQFEARQVLSCQLREGVDRGCVYLYHAPGALRREAPGVSSRRVRRFPAFVQELVRSVREDASLVNQEDFLLQSYATVLENGQRRSTPDQSSQLAESKPSIGVL